MHLNLFIQSRGHHEASWRHPKSSKLPLTDIRYTVEMAQKAEAGLFDSIFLADVLGLWNDVETNAVQLARADHDAGGARRWRRSRIGLIATASTTYTEPYNLARQFCSLDHISRGRIGWNIVTTWSPQAGGNFGGIGQVSHADRYERAEEYMTVVKGLWDSWADDAVLDDRDGGRYADPQRVRPINHAGHALPGEGSAEPAALAAGAAGVRAGGLVGHRPPVRGAPCRGGVHRASGEVDGEGLLCRPEEAGRRSGPRSRSRC